LSHDEYVGIPHTSERLHYPLMLTQLDVTINISLKFNLFQSKTQFNWLVDDRFWLSEVVEDIGVGQIASRYLLINGFIVSL